jgi:hypothetical protein
MIVAPQNTLNNQHNRDCQLNRKMQQGVLCLHPGPSVEEEHSYPNQRPLTANAKRIAEEKEVPQQIGNQQCIGADAIPKSNRR